MFEARGIEITQPVVVDGNSYVDCTFKNCLLIYTGGLFPHFNSCKFIGVQWSFQGPAGTTLNFMQILYKMGFSEAMEETFKQIRDWEPPAGMMANNRSESGE